MNAIPTLSIIIVSWNVRDYLRACLNSIQQTVPTDFAYEVIVVDSASSDSTLEMLHTEFVWVQVLAQDRNIGFTKGNNVGLKAAKGRYLMLLNPDTEVFDQTLVQMTRCLDQHPEVGIVGPHTLNTDGSHQSTRRRFPTMGTAFFESTWLQPYAPRRILDHYYARELPDDAVFPVDWVQGSALMVRREVYEQIGPLDEGYVMYYEELDWCKRASQAGWKALYLGTFKITHHGGKSSEQVFDSRVIHFQQSKLRYFGKFHGWLAAAGLHLFLIEMYVQEIILQSVKWLIGSKRRLRVKLLRSDWKALLALAGFPGMIKG